MQDDHYDTQVHQRSCKGPGRGPKTGTETEKAKLEVMIRMAMMLVAGRVVTIMAGKEMVMAAGMTMVMIEMMR